MCEGERNCPRFFSLIEVGYNKYPYASRTAHAGLTSVEISWLIPRWIRLTMTKNCRVNDRQELTIRDIQVRSNDKMNINSNPGSLESLLEMPKWKGSVNTLIDIVLAHQSTLYQPKYPRFRLKRPRLLFWLDWESKQSHLEESVTRIMTDHRNNPKIK